jgi:guanine nucleotide-binding protein subunit alpha
MGCASSSGSTNTVRIAPISEIDSKIKQDLARERCIRRVLFIGTGESGKSTIFKTLNMVFNRKHHDPERKKYLSVLHGNVLDSIDVLLKECEKSRSATISASKRDTTPRSEEKKIDRYSIHQARIKTILDYCEQTSKQPNRLLKPEHAVLIDELWKLPQIKQTYAGNSGTRPFWLLSNAAYYLDNAIKFANTPMQTSLPLAVGQPEF